MLMKFRLKTIYITYRMKDFADLLFNIIINSEKLIQVYKKLNLTERRVLVVFYCVSTIISYLIPNPVYTYILNIYGLVGLGFMAYQAL